LDIDEGALGTEFDLAPGGCLWQDEVIFFNIAHASIKLNFESGKGFTFCTAEKEDNGQECEPWNTLCTEKFKEVVASARTTFQWHSLKEGQALQDGSFKDWLI